MSDIDREELAGYMDRLVGAFDDPIASAKLRTVLGSIFEPEEPEDLDIVYFLLRLVYTVGALNCCRSAIGEGEECIAEDLRRTWDRVYAWHQPGGSA